MQKRLYRSRENKTIAGVCGGLAEYFEVDPVLVRVVAVISIFTVVSPLVYLILWVLMPQRPESGQIQ
jgi:phage shock protein C